MPEATGPTAVTWTTPILKAVPDHGTGRIHHEGVLSDSSLDIQQDVVDQNLLLTNKSLLETRGKHDWCHGKEDIGDVRVIEPLTVEKSLELYGAQIEGTGTRVAGDVYPLVEPMDLNHPDLKTAHHRFRADARLAYSIGGVAVRKSTGEFVSLIVPRVAICSQAVNPNSVCIRKSLSGALADIGVCDDALAEAIADAAQRPQVVIDADPGYSVKKALKQYLVPASLLDVLVRRAFPDKRDRPPLGGLGRSLGVQEGV